MNEINENYLRGARGQASDAPPSRAKGLFLRLANGPLFKLLTAPLRVVLHLIAYLLLALYALMLIALVRLYRLCSSRAETYNAEEASRRVGEFVQQYPFHLYPVIAKNLELYFLSEAKVAQSKSVVELAIGDGSLSRRVFEGSDAAVFAFDIYPEYLDKVDHDNVRLRVIADCRNPPIIGNGNLTILSNNFLHHVTEKAPVIKNWASKAGTIVFSENTTSWAYGKSSIYCLKSLGFDRAARKRADAFSRTAWQTLLDAESLDRLVSRSAPIMKRYSFYAEFTHFLSMNFSWIFDVFVTPPFELCFGPPTPASFLRMFNGGGVLSRLMWYLTERTAVELIHLDSMLGRDRDAFILYVCAGAVATQTEVDGVIDLECVECGGRLKEHRCTSCDHEYQLINDMLFLTKDANEIADRYDIEQSRKLSRQLL